MAAHFGHRSARQMLAQRINRMDAERMAVAAELQWHTLRGNEGDGIRTLQLDGFTQYK